MKSLHGEYFNHDDQAEVYDLDVAQEGDPIREGYASMLAWIGSRVSPGAAVLDLGSGTGNTLRALPPSCTMTAVDISTRMIEVAKAKLQDRRVSYVIADILEFVEKSTIRDYDYIVSTYALHHLTPDERKLLFSRIRKEATDHTMVLIGDLMYKNDADRDRIIEKHRPTNPDIAAVFENEFFWNIERTGELFIDLGWVPKWLRFSDLSWTVELSGAALT